MEGTVAGETIFTTVFLGGVCTAFAFDPFFWDGDDRTICAAMASAGFIFIVAGT